MKWALVLSGGGARGISYIGMFKAFEQLNIPKPDCIVGCSMGAVIGGLYASGMKVNEMISFFSKDFRLTDYLDISHLGFSQTKLLKILQIGACLNRLVAKKGADSGEKAHTLFKKLSCYQRFESLSIPFYCNAVDLTKGNEVIFEQGFLADAMRASSSYPGFFVPFYHKTAVYVDGCVVNNTPVWIARKKGFKNILAITLGTFKQMGEESFDSSISILTRCMEISSLNHNEALKNAPTHILDIDSNIASYDFSQPLYQIELGYNTTMKAKNELKYFFEKGLLGIKNRRTMMKKTIKRLKNEKVF